MSSLSIDSPQFLRKNAKPGWLDRLAKRIVLDKLKGLELSLIHI